MHCYAPHLYTQTVRLLTDKIPKPSHFPYPASLKTQNAKSTLFESANTYVSGSSGGSWSFYPSGLQDLCSFFMQ